MAMIMDLSAMRTMSLLHTKFLRHMQFMELGYHPTEDSLSIPIPNL